jgi:hypothetical protein
VPPDVVSLLGRPMRKNARQARRTIRSPPMRPTRLTAILTALALGGAALAGCGGSSSGGKDLSDLSTTQLLDRAVAQVKKEKYVSVSGKIDDQGQETGLDLNYVGDDSRGTITLEGTTLELETVGGKTWFKPSDAFWNKQMGAKSAAQIIKIIDGRWIVAEASNQSFAQLIELASKDFVTKEILDPDSKVTKGKVTKVKGIDVIPLKTTDGTLYLDKSNARPVQIVGNGSQGKGTADFSYDKIDPPTAPAAKDQVDLSKISGGS